MARYQAANEPQIYGGKHLQCTPLCHTKPSARSLLRHSYIQHCALPGPASLKLSSPWSHHVPLLTRAHAHSWLDACILLIEDDIACICYIVVIVEAADQWLPEVRGEGTRALLWLSVVWAHHLLGSLSGILQVVVRNLRELHEKTDSKKHDRLIAQCYICCTAAVSNRCTA